MNRIFQHPALDARGLCVLILLSFAARALPAAEVRPVPAATDEARRVMETYQGRGVLGDGSRPLTPSEALGRFRLRGGLAIDPIASEPAVMQPLYLSFDSRGRLWVTQYIQYQFPAGLKVVSYDHHLRAVFDRVPQPPPHGVQGADKVTVMEDKDGDGTYETSRDVITGLNIATAAVKGGGGIWVLNPPYLLFYPDSNDDDIPDEDPKVCLSGFGLEDTHAVANSLCLGPDGWIYGAVGSTTTGNVSSRVSKNIRFEGQHIWRYHPKTEVFEIFAEGGGNTFSLEIDAQGRVFGGTNGSQRGMHYDQGMHGEKNFGKHGVAANPFAFGYFRHMETTSDGKRFSQALCVYDGELMKTELGGRFIAPNSLHNFVYVSRREGDSSTFRAVDEAPLLSSTDRWFRPVDIKVGPDGALYLADWYDTRLSHVRPVDDWSKEDGRIYRVRPASANLSHAPFDLHAAKPEALLAHLSHPNKWFRRQSALELYWRNLTSVLPELEEQVKHPGNRYAFDALCALHLLGGLRDELAIELMSHADPYVRRWVARCSGDKGRMSPSLAKALAALARREPNAEVRAQLLCTARRLPADQALPVALAAMDWPDGSGDKRIPLLLWWVLESKADSDRPALLALFENPALWQSDLPKRYGAQLLARRWAVIGGKENYDACAALLANAPHAEDRAVVIEGLAQAFEGGKIPLLPEPLASALATHLKSQMDGGLLLAVKTGNSDALAQALAIIEDARASTTSRTALIQALAESENPAAVRVMLSLFNQTGNVALRRAALPYASHFSDNTLADAVIQGYEARFSGDTAIKDAAHRMLASRKDWARRLLAAIDRREIRAKDIAADIVRQIGLYADPEIDRLLLKHWGSAIRLSTEEKAAEAKRIRGIVVEPGDVNHGRELFQNRCAACHRLFGEGGQVGPDLSGYERSNPNFWLVGILDPSLEIREGFGAYTLRTRDGQSLIGMLVKQDAGGVVLKDMSGQDHRRSADQIEALDALPQSLMPEGLLSDLDTTALRDLFAYLMRPDNG